MIVLFGSVFLIDGEVDDAVGEVAKRGSALAGLSVCALHTFKLAIIIGAKRDKLITWKDWPYVYQRCFICLLVFS